MLGYIFDYYKYTRKEDSTEESKDKSTKLNYITFGDFDRLEVNKVTDFTRFRDLSITSRSWRGDRVPILLYEIDENNQICYDEEHFIIKENNDNTISDMLFIGLTIFQFRYNQIQDKTDISEFIKTCKQNIISILDKKRPNLKYNVFGVLGTSGISILWLADQYEDVLDCINYLKNYCLNGSDKEVGEEKNLFLSAKTIFSKNDITNSELLKNKIEHIKGKALLYITVKTSLDNKTSEFITENFKSNVEKFHCAGEHDLIVLVDACKIYNKFNKEEKFNPKDPFYSNNILQTKTTLCREGDIYLHLDSNNNKDNENENRIISNITETINDENENRITNNITEIIDNVKKDYKKLREVLKERYPKTAGMVDTLDLLYCDFNTKVSSAVNSMWAIDFAYQFNGIIKCILDFTLKFSQTGLSHREYLQIVKDILDNFKHQVFHIAESNHLNLEPPICHLRYTGHCNLILYAYFGVIKKIIKLIYSFQKVNKQSEIIPLITVDTMPIVESSLFVDYDNYQDSRIVIINLPEASLFDLPRYILFLYHELFHYAVPQDRYYRDRLLGIIYISEVLKKLCISYSINSLDINNIEDDYNYILERSINSVVYNFVIQYYEKIDNNIINVKVVGEKYKDIDKIEFTRVKYEEALYHFVLDIFEDSPIKNQDILQDYLSYLYDKKNIIIENLEKEIEALFIQDNNKIKDLKKIMYSIFNFLEKSNSNKNIDITIRNFLDKIFVGRDKIFRESNNLMNALREVSADIPMVELSQINVAKYLIFCTIIKKNLLIQVDYKDFSDYIRIGLIINYIIGFAEKEEQLKINKEKEEFIT